MRDYHRPPRGRGNWRGRGAYQRHSSYHDRYSSSSRPSYESRRYYSRERDRSRDRHSSYSRRDRHSRDRHGRSRSRSPRRRYSRDRRSRSGSRSSYSSSSRSGSRHRSRSRSGSSRSRSPSPGGRESGQQQRMGSSDDRSRSQPQSQEDQSATLDKESSHDEHKMATVETGRPTNMTIPPAPNSLGQDTFTIPPPSRWEREGSQEEIDKHDSKDYQDSVDELYAGLTLPAEQKKVSMSPVNLQKKSLVITFNNDRFQNAPTTVAAATLPPKDPQPAFETAVTPPHVSQSDGKLGDDSNNKQKSLFPAANRPMWKPVGEVDLPSPLITEKNAPVAITTTNTGTESTERVSGATKKKSKAELQKEIRDLEKALEKKRNAKKTTSEDTAEETPAVGKEPPMPREGRQGRSQSQSSDRSSSCSSRDSSNERHRRESRGKGRKKHIKKDRNRREKGERSRLNSKDRDKPRHVKSKSAKQQERETDELYDDDRAQREKQRVGERDPVCEKVDNGGEDALHASLLSDNQDMQQDPPQGSAAQSAAQSAAVTGTSFVTGVVASQQAALSTNQAMIMTGMEHSIAPKDVSAVDHFLQSLGLSGGTSLAQTSVSNSLPSTLMSNTFDHQRTLPPVAQEDIPYPAEEPVREQPAVSNFGFTYTYQDGQSLPGLDLAVDQPEAPAPETGFQNADEEDEYLYGSNVSGQMATEEKVEEYVPESKPPSEKVEKDEQLNKILSAIGFDFDMAKQIVEQTKRKEEQTKEQSQLKGLRKGKKEKSSLEPPQKKEESKPDSISEKMSAKGEEIAKDEREEKESTPVSAQPIPSIVGRVAQSAAKAESSDLAHTSSGNWSNHQYYGPTTSADYFSPKSSVPSTTATSTAVPPYGPPVPPVATPDVQPPALPAHGPPAPPSLGHPALPPHPPPSLPPSVALPHGPPLPPHGPPIPPHGMQGIPFDQGYTSFQPETFPHDHGQQQWPQPSQYEQVGQADSYYRRSMSPGYRSPGRYSHSRSSSFSRSRSRSPYHAFSGSDSFTSSRSRSPLPPKRESPRIMKRKYMKYQGKRAESPLDSDGDSSRRKKKKARKDDRRDTSKEKSKHQEKEKLKRKKRVENKDKNSVKGIKVSLARDQDEETSRRIITIPKSRSRSPEKKEKPAIEEESLRQERLKKETEMLLKQQENMLIERMEKKKREMEKEYEREKRKKEKELVSLDWEFEKREKEIKKREEIIIRVEDKLRKEQEKRMLADMKVEEEKQRKLKKEKEDFKRRLHFLQKELERLKKNQGDLLRKKQKEKDGHKDPELMENSQLQEEILNQIKRLQHAYSEAYGKPLPEEPPNEEKDEGREEERSRNSRERSPRKSRRSQEGKDPGSEKGRQREKERELSEGKSRFNFVYFDSGDHWCMCCNKVLPDINGFLIHLHSKKHMKNCDPNDRPWKALTPQEKKPPQSSSTSSSSSTIQTPFKGELLMVPTNAFYCRLCKIFMGDVLCASEHVRQRSHNLKYLKFTEDNPFYEKQLSIKRDSMNPSKDSSSEAEDDKQEDVKIATKDSQMKESKEDTSQQKKKLPFVGTRPGYVRKTKFDVRDVTTAPSKPADSQSLEHRREDKSAEKGKEEETDITAKDEDKDPDLSEKDTEDGKKDSKFKFKFSSGKKLKTPTTTSSQSTSTTLSSSVTSNSSVPPKATVSAPKTLPMIGKRSKSKLVISRPEAPPEPEPEQETEEKYKEMKNSLDRFLQMKSGSLPVVVEKGKDKQNATKNGEKPSAPPQPPLPPPPPPTGAGHSGDNAAISNRDNIAKAYQDIAAKEKAAEKQAELLAPPQPPTSIIHNPPLPPTGVSDVIKETLTVYSTAHQYKMPTPPIAPPPMVNTSLPPPPPPSFMIAAGVIPAPPTLPAPQAPPILPDPPQLPDQPPPPPPGTQDELMNDFLAEYGELLPEMDGDGDDSDEGVSQSGDNEDICPPGEEQNEGSADKGGKDGQKNVSSGSEMEDEYLYWY